MNLFIVNRTDRPCERLIAEQVGDRLYYINPELREQWKDRPMSMDDATPVEDFGVICDAKAGILAGVKHPDIIPSAKYSDGRPRKWQGSSMFTFKYPGPSEPAEAPAAQEH